MQGHAQKLQVLLHPEICWLRAQTLILLRAEAVVLLLYLEPQLPGTMASNDQLLPLLRQHWGHQSFRPLQRQALQATIQGRDSLVILPTGLNHKKILAQEYVLQHNY